MGINLQGLAITWFRREDWPRWLEIDPQFQPDYAHWLKRMDKALVAYRAAGIPIIKPLVHPDAFLAWAQANGKSVGPTARAAYAALKARDHDSQQEKR